MTGPDPAERPVLRIVGGKAAPEDIAALVVVLATRPAAAAGEPARHPRLSARAELLRRPHRPGPGAWLASGRPR